MKRRDVLTGIMGLAAAAVVPRLDRQMPAQGQILSGVVDRDPPELDPISDRERPVFMPAVADMDQRDSQTMADAQVSIKAETNIDTKFKAQAEANAETNVEAKELPAKQAQAELQQESKSTQEPVKVAVNKSIDFARDYGDDLFVAEADLPLLHSVFLRLKKLQKTIGFGNFNLVGLDEALAYGRRFSAIGEFTQAEQAFIEKIFFTKASDYGFYGQKVTEQLTSPLKKSDTVKIPYSGHYLFNNESLAYYKKLQQDVGKSIILTSGIRSNIKQLYLFLAKTVRVNGNLSRASRSLAPPGYSYHGIGDFDVGKVGWGTKNFTDDFAGTDEFKRMQDLGYIAIRYDHGNQLGVRFEPWHIKVV